MPHSNRTGKKRNPVSAQKRLEVTDDDGWTHVTSGGNVRRVVRTTKVRSDRETNKVDETELVLSPAEAPARLTFEELEAQYRGYKERWVQSETWQKLRVQLDQRIHDQETVTSSQDLDVDGIVCIGLGSPSGFLRDGWVDRRAVSMYQLAALETIKDVFISSFPSPFGKSLRYSTLLVISQLTQLTSFMQRCQPLFILSNLRPRSRFQRSRPCTS